MLHWARFVWQHGILDASSDTALSERIVLLVRIGHTLVVHEAIDIGVESFSVQSRRIEAKSTLSTIMSNPLSL